MKKLIYIFFFHFLILNIFGCSSVDSKRYDGFQPVENANNTKQMQNNEEENYILQKGDILDIKFFYNKELNETLTIRPDGKISLQLIGEVQAAGLSPSELNKTLAKLYANELNNCEITVIVKEFSGQKIYVGGEVNNAGIYNFSGNLTVIQAIFMAGGVKETATLKSIVVLRNQGTAQPLFKIINLENDLFKHKNSNDLELKPYDVVFVPKTTVAKINQFIDQYIRKMIPITTTAGFSYIKALQ